MDIKLPKLGEGAETGTVVTLFVKEGDRIEKDQAILELENEKAVASIPSTATGVVSRIFVKEGDKISVGQKILSLDGAQAEASAAKPKKAAPAPKAPAPKTAEVEDTEEEPGEEQEAPVAAGVEPPTSPSLRKMAHDLGIELSRVRGSGSGGRVVMDDLRAYIQKIQKLALQPKAASGVLTEKPASERIDFSKWGEISKKPMSQLRQVISRRMVESWTTIPHVTQFDDADITALNALRKKLAADYEKQGTRLTMTPFVLKALVSTLKKHPLFNASIDESNNEIVFKEYFHIGIAVDTEAGLLVPVIRDVDKKSLLQLSKDLEDIARRARERKIGIDEMKGGSFTISNQGGIGGAHFTPIVNKPEVAILGLGRGAMKPVVVGDKIEARMSLPLALSYDHRLIDGGNAARFITDLVGAIQNFSEADAKI